MTEREQATSSVVAVYRSHSDAEEAVRALEKGGLPIQKISIIGRDFIGPWRGTFDWRRQSGRIEVPAHTREAIVHLGLFGAIGQLDIDAVEMRPLVSTQR